MKLLTKKGFLQKTIIAILLVLCVNFIVPTYSHANFGGVFSDPIVDFLCSLGDAIINILQKCMTDEWGASFHRSKYSFLYYRIRWIFSS